MPPWDHLMNLWHQLGGHILTCCRLQMTRRPQVWGPEYEVSAATSAPLQMEWDELSMPILCFSKVIYMILWWGNNLLPNGSSFIPSESSRPTPSHFQHTFMYVDKGQSVRLFSFYLFLPEAVDWGPTVLFSDHLHKMTFMITGGCSTWVWGIRVEKMCLKGKQMVQLVTMWMD